MIPLNVHTHYSLLQGYCKPSTLVKLAAKYDYKALAVTDLDSLSGTVNFLSAFDGSGITPIIGAKFKLAPSNGYITLIAKNLSGWKELIGLFAYTNLSENKEVTIEHLKFTKNCICIVGGYDNVLNKLAILKSSVYTVANPTQSLSFYLTDNYEAQIAHQLSVLKELFDDRLYVGIQRCENLPIDTILDNIVEILARQLNIKCVALNNTYVHTDDELEELRILICGKEKVKFSSINEHVISDEHGHLFRFFNKSKFGLYDKEYYKDIYLESYIKNTEEILDRIEPFSLLKNPQAPNFICPEGMSQQDYLLKLCRDGWQRVLPKLDKNRLTEYVERIKHELEVINSVGIEGYFLVVQDYVNWAKKRMMVGPGRGSAAGCFTSYLLNITSIDPLKYGLMFERFYNAGRNSPGKVSFPDIDVDFPVAQREAVINYIREKYGTEYVSQVFTLQEIQGRSAIRDVLRIYGACPNEFINEISKKIPQKASIADKMEEEKEKSILRWTLNNEPDILRDWCELKDGELVGEYAQYFDKAIKIEGTFRNTGKHASAVIIGSEPIASICPMIKDKGSNELLAAIEFEELESIGLLKADVLGLAILDKLQAVNELLEFGKLSDVNIEQEVEDTEE